MTDVLVQIVGTGELHRGSLVNGKLQSFEGCNLDDAGETKVLTDDEAAHALANAERHQLCRNDFPDVGEPDEAA